ncbi:MAG: ABC transporter substrate-binding protein [Firmicutes bacterium]|nr:ABC transporter substrate-binding protein [Bacillota bacterium]
MFLTSCSVSNDNRKVNIIALSGPTGIGFGYMNNKISNGELTDYNLEIATSPDQATAALVNGSVDIASVPSNVAAILYNKGVDLQVITINAGNVLTLVQRTGAEPITSFTELNEKEVFTTGQGATPEAIIQHLSNKENIELDLEFVPDPTEIIAKFKQGTADYAILPQPAATNAIMQEGENGQPLATFVQNIADTWSKYYPDTPIATGVMVAKTDFVNNHREMFDKFLTEYKQSVEWMIDPINIDKAAQYIVDMKIIPSLPIAKQALPNSGVVFVEKQNMKEQLEQFYKILLDFKAPIIGGKLPDNDFYFI